MRRKLLIYPVAIAVVLLIAAGGRRGGLLQSIADSLHRERRIPPIDDPKQDLSPRIIELFKESPAVYLLFLFRQFEGWLKRTFGGD